MNASLLNVLCRNTNTAILHLLDSDVECGNELTCILAVVYLSWYITKFVGIVFNTSFEVRQKTKNKIKTTERMQYLEFSLKIPSKKNQFKQFFLDWASSATHNICTDYNIIFALNSSTYFTKIIHSTSWIECRIVWNIRDRAGVVGLNSRRFWLKLTADEWPVRGPWRTFEI